MARECKTCGITLGRKNKSGYCRKHVAAHNLAQPHIRERQLAGIRRKFATDPAYLDDLRRRARALGCDPVVNAKRTRHFIENRIWEIGTEAARNPISRAKAGRRSSATKLGWCPPHLRADYLYLVRGKRLLAADARALIEERNEVEMRRWRASVGAA